MIALLLLIAFMFSGEERVDVNQAQPNIGTPKPAKRKSHRKGRSPKRAPGTPPVFCRFYLQPVCRQNGWLGSVPHGPKRTLWRWSLIIQLCKVRVTGQFEDGRIMVQTDPSKRWDVVLSLVVMAVFAFVVIGVLLITGVLNTKLFPDSLTVNTRTMNAPTLGPG